MNRTIPYLNKLSRTIPSFITLTRNIPYLNTLTRTIPYLNTLPSAANQIRVLRHPSCQPIRLEYYVTRELSARVEALLGSRLELARYSLSYYIGNSPPPPNDLLTTLLLMFSSLSRTLLLLTDSAIFFGPQHVAYANNTLSFRSNWTSMA